MCDERFKKPQCAQYTLRCVAYPFTQGCMADATDYEKGDFSRRRLISISKYKCFKLTNFNHMFCKKF